MSTAQLASEPLASIQSRRYTARVKPIVCADHSSQQLMQHIERIAPSAASVLIIGESGTGKELIARRLHALSGRRGPFVALNCGALTSSLAEAELFGHESGAYTGATGARAGWFETANGGTLFLDEIGDLTLSLQVKLLRVLQEREVVRVGSRKAIPLDVRLIVATNIDLREAVAQKRFRADLFYRLNVAAVEIAPLRARPADILPLAKHFMSTYSEQLQRPAPRLLLETEEALLAHGWPGNIRELENVIHFAILVCRDEVIRPEDLRFTNILAQVNMDGQDADASVAPDAHELKDLLAPLQRLFQTQPAQLLPRLEELIVRRAYDFCAGNQVQSARLLGISRNVLRTQLKRFSLISADGKPAD